MIFSQCNKRERDPGRGKGYAIQTARRALSELVIRDTKTRVSRLSGLFWVGVGKGFWMQSCLKPWSAHGNWPLILNADRATQTQKPLPLSLNHSFPTLCLGGKAFVSNLETSQREESLHPSTQAKGIGLVMMAREISFGSRVLVLEVWYILESLGD